MTDVNTTCLACFVMYQKKCLQIEGEEGKEGGREEGRRGRGPEEAENEKNWDKESHRR